MKILFVTYRFFPERGGSETYTYSVAKYLRKLGTTVIFFTIGENTRKYSYDGFDVWSIGFGDFTSDNFNKSIISLIIDEKPSWLHFHYIPSVISPCLMDEIKKMKIRLAFTFHHPSSLCPKGDFVRYGNPCLVPVNVDSCFPCVASSLGAKSLIPDLLNIVPMQVLGFFADFLRNGKFKTALKLKGKIFTVIKLYIEIMGEFDKIFVLADWCKEKLKTVGIEESKILVSRLGVTNCDIKLLKLNTMIDDKIKLIFVGRLDSVKGIHVVIKALMQINNPRISLDIFGPFQSASTKLKILLEGKDIGKVNVFYKGLLKDELVVETISKYNLAVVPSMSFETGPYTVIEAFQAGVPVVGTDIPGINEMVISGHNGVLVPFGSIDGWVEVFDKFLSNYLLINQLAKNVSWSRSMENVACDFIFEYNK